MADAGTDRAPRNVPHGIPRTHKDRWHLRSRLEGASFSGLILAVRPFARRIRALRSRVDSDPKFRPPRPDFFFLWLYATLSYSPSLDRLVSANRSCSWNRRMEQPYRFTRAKVKKAGSGLLPIAIRMLMLRLQLDGQVICTLAPSHRGAQQ